jgi:hypothetical protein
MGLMRPLGLLAAAAAVVALAGCIAAGGLTVRCAHTAPASPATVQEMTFLGRATLAREPGTMSEHFGGISGLEYDLAHKHWLLLSDDRSERAPARLYRVDIGLSAKGFGPTRFVSTVPLPLAARERPDPEALRALPGGCLLAWASEGDGAIGVPPSVRLITPEGMPTGELALPTILTAFGSSAGAARGPRANLSLEGLAVHAPSRSLWLAMEAPLLQDGPLADLNQGGAVRFFRLGLAGGAAAQFVYLTDPIPAAPSGGRHRADNGVSEILQLGEGRLLVVERSGREVDEGRFAYDVRLYEADVANATDVSSIDSLAAASWMPMRKRLLLPAHAPGLAGIGNVEAAAWGPRLVDGRMTLLLVTDDNFAPGELTQMLLFAVR